MTYRIAFICTANACRSQIAEGLARHILPPHVEVFSAGTTPTQVHPMARQTMAELGVSIDGQHAKAIDALPPEGVDEVITLCSDAETKCPQLPGATRQHWPIEDPAAVQGDAAAVRAAFARTVDALHGRLAQLAARLAPAPAVGVIGGSGFYELPGLTDVHEVQVETPFGPPSDAFRVGRLGSRRLVFLARHGRQHTLLPSEVNARANIYGFKRLGVRKLISVTAVGSLREHIAPGDVVLAHQLIDRTMGRPNTYFGDGVVAHVSMADPVCLTTSAHLAEAARAETERVHVGGTYVCIEGPQFSSRAESELMRSWGADLVGMTALPEARLAREAEICYAPVCMPTDYDCWHPSEGAVEVDDVIATLRANVELGRRIIGRALSELEPEQTCGCRSCLDMALLTHTDHIQRRPKVRLHAILARRLAL